MHINSCEDTVLTEKERNIEKINEFIGLVKKSNLFTIFIEGADDLFFYEPLEIICEKAPKTIEITPVGGREIALGIFNGLKDTQYINKVIFIVDKDTWVHLGKPKEFDHVRLICTAGYSIENDVFIDRNLVSLMQTLGVYTEFDNCLKAYLQWYALAIQRIINDTTLKGDSIDIHPNMYFKENLKDTLILLREHETFPTELSEEIYSDFLIKLRGKNLFYLFEWCVNNRFEKKKHISDTDDKSRQKRLPSYNTKLIMEETTRTLRKENLNRIFDTAENFAMQGF